MQACCNLFTITDPMMCRQIIQHVEKLKSQLEEQERIRKEAVEKKAAATERRAHVEKEMKEFSAHREDKLESLQKELATGKKELAASAPAIKKMQQEIDLSKEEAGMLRDHLEWVAK